jgi:hypothetical protein
MVAPSNYRRSSTKGAAERAGRGRPTQFDTLDCCSRPQTNAPGRNSGALLASKRKTEATADRRRNSTAAFSQPIVRWSHLLPFTALTRSSLLISLAPVTTQHRCTTQLNSSAKRGFVNSSEDSCYPNKCHRYNFGELSIWTVAMRVLSRHYDSVTSREAHFLWCS